MLRFSSAPRLLACRVLVLLLATAGTSLAADSSPAQVTVYFSPHGGCTDVIVRELGAPISKCSCKPTASREQVTCLQERQGLPVSPRLDQRG